MGDEAETTTPATSSTATPTSQPLKRRRKHRVGHYVILSVNIILSVSCLIGAGAMVFAQHILNTTQKTAAIQSPSSTIAPLTTEGSGNTDPVATSGSVVPGSSGVTDPSTPATDPLDTTPFPDADPQAKNFLITGADNGACIDPSSPYAGAFTDRGSLGERSDTVMVMRVDPSTNRAAILSFPRDLWVKIHGTNGSNRINAAYTKDNPQKLIDTIYDNFQVRIDHYIQIDFCAFKYLVDAVDGVSVPFAYPTRDRNTGLNLTAAGCVNFNGDAALAYVRSRHYQYLNPKTGKWTEDGSSDLGRISRQQDFMRRAVAKVLSRGVFTPAVASGLIKVATTYVTTDADLTLDLELKFAGVLKGLDPDTLQTYQIEATGATKVGQAVLLPKIGTPNMKAILDIFKGKTQLATAPAQTFDTTPTVTIAPTTTSTPATTSTVPGASTSSSSSTTSTTTTVKQTGPTTTLPASDAAENNKGISPPKDMKCP